MSIQANENEVVFKYNPAEPGKISSDVGLKVGQHVVIEYMGRRIALQDIIKFPDLGYIKEIEFNNNHFSLYSYRIDIVGAGPSSGHGTIYFTDGEPCTYGLSLYKHDEDSHYVRFNSNNPLIKI